MQSRLAPALPCAAPIAALMLALFIGTVQGLVMQAMLSGQVSAMGALAPEVFAIYLRGIAKKELT